MKTDGFAAICRFFYTLVKVPVCPLELQPGRLRPGCEAAADSAALQQPAGVSAAQEVFTPECEKSLFFFLKKEKKTLSARRPPTAAVPARAGPPAARLQPACQSVDFL